MCRFRRPVLKISHVTASSGNSSNTSNITVAKGVFGEIGGEASWTVLYLSDAWNDLPFAGVVLEVPGAPETC